MKDILVAFGRASRSLMRRDIFWHLLWPGVVSMLVWTLVAVALQWLNDVFNRSGAHVLAQTRAPAWLVEAVAFGFHFHLFIFTALAPVLLWVLMNRAFVQALWSQAINVQPQALGRATEQGTQ